MTHIHAYYAQVEEAKEKVAVAKSELETAELALKQHPDYKPEAPKAETKVAPVRPVTKGTEAKV